MGECRHDLIKPGSAGDRKPGPGCADRSCKRGTTARLALLIVLLAAGAGAAGAAGPVATEVWESENLELDARGSVQVTIGYGQIPVRRWTLVVDGADRNCDLNVRRVRDGSLLYQETDGRRHMVSVPWGEGEQISLVVTNRDAPAVFVLSLVGPPRDQVHLAYSYHVNRALEKYADGQRLDAESECRDALAEDPDDAVAKVLLAGFLRDKHFYDQATALNEEALAADLPVGMREVAEGLRRDLIHLRAPLPLPVQNGMNEIEDLLERGQGAEALGRTDGLLGSDLELEAGARGRLHLLRGRALAQLGRNFEALDAYTTATQLERDRGFEAVVSYHMGSLFMDMDNLPQARGAFARAVQAGLPTGLDVQAREQLQTIEKRLKNTH
ncbi:hypothetical protein KDM41_02310 [bacterium]|nr:hypothetical protein [bacterium]